MRSAAESRADFIHKLGIALKEMKETRGWLHFIVIAGLLSKRRVEALSAEAYELCCILGKSIATAKFNRARPRQNPPKLDSICNSQFLEGLAKPANAGRFFERFSLAGIGST